MANPDVRFLMCRPDYFGVNYVINPWMKGNVGRTASTSAREQWEALRRIVGSISKVELVEPQRGLPDMVFTANAGLLIGNDVVISHFAYRERQPEEKHFKQWFEDKGFKLHFIPPDLPFEGGVDALLDREGRWLWAAYGQRSSLESHPLLAMIFNIKVVSLRLVDPRFYHLDTCFLPLPDRYLLYYPDAFDIDSNRMIESLVPEEKRILIDSENAVSFSANSIVIGHTIIMNRCTATLCGELTSIGFKVVQTELSEFIKGGGSAKCLTLLLDEVKPSVSGAVSPVAGRKVLVEGQLIDSELMSRICDDIARGGGAFLVKGMHLGQKRTEYSRAEIEVTAPNQEKLDYLIQKIIKHGARLPEKESKDAVVATVVKRGVAPERFYGTTIYPTQVRIKGEWLDVEKQRMDGVVVISGISARCKLLRNLKEGEKVVVGSDGIRSFNLKSEHMYRDQFGFMASSSSSERRVELAVESIAWEMKRIKENGGHFVVVAGPVVIHTGGGVHLAWMARNGYLNALLGGNAIAVHDIENAMLGTSLGVDLKTGNPVEGGHRNHLEVINRIRKAGSIKGTVESGKLKSGLFYELIRNAVPFSLAGSIRDDGPLPETKMDIIKAQEEYAAMIEGADMILMLSSMLHSIATGNMTPAGVKLVCVDINPSVVTKLADRGSLESVGVVTDVGLFLSLLVRRLQGI